MLASLEQEADAAYEWRLTWTAINGGFTALSLAGLLVLPPKDRADLAFNAAVSAESTAFTFFWPMDVEEDARLAVEVEGRPEVERCERLEALFAHSREDERDRLTWPWHVGNFLSALAPAAVVWFAFHRRGEAALSLLGGFASGELELLTQPSGLLGERTGLHAAVSIAFVERGLSMRYGFAW